VPAKGDDGPVVSTADGRVRGFREEQREDLPGDSIRRAAGRRPALAAAGAREEVARYARRDGECQHLPFTSMSSAGAGRKKPVIVWIHGGGNIDGESNDYDGNAGRRFNRHARTISARELRQQSAACLRLGVDGPHRLHDPARPATDRAQDADLRLRAHLPVGAVLLPQDARVPAACSPHDRHPVPVSRLPWRQPRREPDQASGLPRGLNAQKTQLSDQLVAAWTKFAKYGNPNGAGDAPWPQFTWNAPALLQENIPSTPYGAAQFYADHKCDYWFPALGF
jgi:hypothetical protein